MPLTPEDEEEEIPLDYFAGLLAVGLILADMIVHPEGVKAILEA